jgi:hypothetical protein
MNSYPSKAAQQNALDVLTIQLQVIGKSMRESYLAGSRDSVSAQDLYYRFPDSIGQLRDSMIELVGKHFPQYCNELRGLIVARDFIKSQPIIKPVSKASGKRAALEQVLRDRGSNDSLEAELLKVAPKLAADFEAQVRNQFAKDPSDWRIGRFVLRTRALDGSFVHNIDTLYLAKQAEQYGIDTSKVWYYKMASKLGALVDVKVVRDQCSSDINVFGFAKDGIPVEIRQQIVYKISINGRHFHQFPARIYVNGHFFTEAAFAKAFHAVNAGGAK